MSKIYLFRHAQASYMSANYDKLSNKGEEQSRLLGVYLRKEGIRFDKMYRGPLFRHQQTVEIALAQDSLANQVKILDGLKEHQAPATLKMLMPELVKNDPVIKGYSEERSKHPDKQKHYGLKIFDYFMEGWTSGYFQHESMQDWKSFKEEVKDCFEHILSQTEKGETVAIFTSGGTITAILHHVLQLKDELAAARLNVSIQNASTTELLYNQTNCSLFRFNQVHYLPSDYHSFV